jgi:hypothetical protein
MGTLVIDRIRMYETPQSGTWLLCLRIWDVNDPENSDDFHIPNKEYEGDGIDITPVDPSEPADQQRLELSDIEPGTEIKFWMGLDAVHYTHL